MIELQPKQREAARDPVSPKKSCGHALIADALRHCGVKRVVGITGTPVDQIFSECAARGIRPIGARHQQTAVLMAATSNAPSPVPPDRSGHAGRTAERF